MPSPFTQQRISDFQQSTRYSAITRHRGFYQHNSTNNQYFINKKAIIRLQVMPHKIHLQPASTWRNLCMLVFTLSRRFHSTDTMAIKLLGCKSDAVLSLIGHAEKFPSTVNEGYWWAVREHLGSMGQTGSTHYQHCSQTVAHISPSLFQGVRQPVWLQLVSITPDELARCKSDIVNHTCW